MTTRSPAILVVIAIVAMAGAALTFLLPPLDASLPGGSMVWQLACALTALSCVFELRPAAVTTLPTGLRRLLRACAWLAGVVAAVWLFGIVLLWLLWPR